MFEGSSSTPAGADRAVRRSRHHRATVLALPLVIISLAAPLPTYASSSGPYIEQAELLPTGEIGNASPGTSIALSGDGQTALIGGPGDDEGQGAVWAFHRHGAWTQQAKLTGLDEAGKGRFGQSVALSKDGRMALVGGPQDDAGIGAVWTFTRSGGHWEQRGLKVTAEGEVGEGLFGSAVALSSNGKTALVGSPNENQFTGAAWVFARRGSAWIRRGEKLTGGNEEVGEAFFGSSVALSATGKTAIVGGPQDTWLGGHGCARPFTCAGGPTGAAWIFERSHASWTQQGFKLTAVQASHFGSYFGESVALSGDGNTALIGGPLDDWPNENEGAVLVFTRSDSLWSQQGERLKNSEPGTERFDRFGTSVALADDGNTALIGPKAWVFSRSATTWTQAPRLIANGKVALSSDASTALVGTTVYVNSAKSRAERHVGQCVGCSSSFAAR